MKKRTFLKSGAIAATGVGTVASGLGSAFAQGTAPLRKITIAMAGDGFHISILHLASLGGFFREEGLEDDFVDLNSGTRAVAAVMGGSADFGPIGLIHAIKAFNQGGEIAIVGPVCDTLNLLLFLGNDALKKTGITVDMPIDEKVKRLQGMRIGTTSPGSVIDTYVRTLFKARGMDPDKVVRLLPLGSGANMMAALEKGATDGFVWSAPIPEIAQAKGWGKVVINPLLGEVPEARNVPYLSLVTSKLNYEKKPEEMRRTLRAITKAIKFAQDKPEEAKAFIRTRFPNVERSIFDAAWQSCRHVIPKSPVITEEQLASTLKWLRHTEPAMVAPYDKIVYPKYALQAASEILKK